MADDKKYREVGFIEVNSDDTLQSKITSIFNAGFQRGIKQMKTVAVGLAIGMINGLDEDDKKNINDMFNDYATELYKMNKIKEKDIKIGMDMDIEI